MMAVDIMLAVVVVLAAVSLWMDGLGFEAILSGSFCESAQVKLNWMARRCLHVNR